MGEGTPNDISKELAIIKESSRRYFASMGGYIEGDLIAKSQIEELRDYLRITRGNSVAMHPKLLGRVSSDQARLVRLFYKESGAETLRAAAEKSNGYEVFDRMCHQTKRFAELADAVERGAIETLIQMAAQESQKKSQAEQEKKDAPKRRTKPPRIYTLEDYLDAVAVEFEKKAAAAAK